MSLNKVASNKWWMALPLSLLLQIASADVELSEAARDNFGIATVVATATQVSHPWQATAQVLDASTLIATLSDMHAAQAAAMASSSELQRLEALYKADNAALKNLEAARAQAAVDRAHAQSLQAQLLGGWGAAISNLPAAARDALVQNLLSGKQVLIRADLASNAPASLTGNVRLTLLSEHLQLTAKLLGSLPQTTAASLGKAYLLSVVLPDKLDLQPGQVLSAQLQDSARAITAMRLPPAAIVRWQGKHWVYVQMAEGHYQRLVVTLDHAADEQVLVTQGIKPGDKVVTVGAGLLLGVELNPATEAEAEKE